MGSSERVDSGKGRSNFSQTCTLLSQYLKEKGSFGDFNLSLTPKGTTNLIPKTEQPGQGQMTIFYAGQVLVFDDIPADKAKEIITLATASAPPQKPASAIHSAQLPPLASDLPIARKNSLARFLEKRKDRITATSPYQATKTAVKEEPWLELGSQSPLQI